MRIGKVILRWLVAIMALLTIIVVIMLTPIGLKISMRLAAKITPGHLQYEHVSGIVTGPIEIKGFKYDHDGTRISIQNFKINWHPLDLLWGKLTITELQANRVFLTLGPAKKTKMKMPFVIQIERAILRNVAIGTKPDKYPFFLDHLRLESTIVPNKYPRPKGWGIYSHMNFACANQVRTDGDQREALGSPLETPPQVGSRSKLRGIRCANKIAVNASATMSKPFQVQTRLHATGNLSNYALTLRITNQHINWTVSGTGNSDSIKLHTHESQTLGGSLSATANVHWSPSLQWDINLNARNLNFNKLKADWPHALSIQLNTKGKLVNKVPRFSAKTLIISPQAKISAMAEQDPGLKLQWNANISRLSSLIPGSQGSLNTKGSWTGTINKPITKGSINATALSLFGFNVKSLEGQWNIAPNSGKISGKIGIKNVNISFDTQGNLVGTQWRGKFNKLNVTSSQYTNWRLLKPSNITLSTTQVLVPDLCLRSTSQRTSLCIKGQWDADKAWQFIVKGQRVDPSLLTNLALPKLTLYGKTSIDATINGLARKLQNASAKVTINKGRFRYRLNGNNITSQFQSSNMSFHFDHTGLRSQIDMLISKNNTMNVSFSLDKKRMHGNIRANITDLTLLKDLIPDAVDPKGKLQTNLTVSGTTSSPRVTGNLSFQKGSVALERLGITLTNINAQLSATPNAIRYSVSAYSKDKPIQINGNSIWTKKGLKSDVNIHGTHVLIINTPEYTIYASPNLQISVLGKTLHMKGNITIPKGIIQPHESTNTISLPYDQIVYTHGQPKQRVSPWQIFANLSVTLGDNVQIKTSGLDAKVTGTTTLVGTAKQPTIGNGRIKILEGTYSAYGKTLTLEPGSYIQFVNSPVSNPSVNIRATKKIAVNTGQQPGLDDLIVGISLTGTFRRPKIILFSIPGNLSQADILSYLILGYSSSLNTASNLDLLMQAATALKLGGDGSGIGGAISQIKQGLGLSEFGIESETLVDAIGNPLDQQTAFVVGKHLTQRIYIRYSIGLGQGPFAPVNIFQIRYLFSKNWILQTDSSSESNGFDIMYSIQK